MSASVLWVTSSEWRTRHPHASSCHQSEMSVQSVLTFLKHCGHWHMSQWITSVCFSCGSLYMGVGVKNMNWGIINFSKLWGKNWTKCRVRLNIPMERTTAGRTTLLLWLSCATQLNNVCEPNQESGGNVVSAEVQRGEGAPLRPHPPKKEKENGSFNAHLFQHFMGDVTNS